LAFVIIGAVSTIGVLTVSVIEEVALGQELSKPVAVKVIAISPVVVGVNVGFNACLLLKVPLALDQVKVP